MQLLYAPQSPFARKVRAVAIELGLDDKISLQYAKVVPGLSNVSYAEAVNPLRKIPALVTDEGQVIYDSGVICEYLDAMSGGKLIPGSLSNNRWRVLTNNALAHGMCEAVISIRYETDLRPQPLRWSVWIGDQWDKINSGLAWFEGHSDQFNEPLDISHITLGCALGYIDFRYGEFAWAESFPKLDAWYQSLRLRPSFSRTQPVDPPAR